MKLRTSESTHQRLGFSRHHHLFRTVAATTILSLWIPSMGIGAEETRPPQRGRLLERGVHIVRSGETLRDITRYYLGSDDRWRENHELNPQISNPHLIHPGQRITVLRESTLSVPNAVLIQVAGQVEDRPMPQPWGQALVRDLLLERDGIRTRAASSARMRFPDGTSILLTEDSLVFLRRSGTQLTGIESKAVEIVEGQADIDSHLEPGSQARVEILVGGVLATMRMDNHGVGRTRAKKVEDVGDFVMVYEGSSEVEAAGETVQVARGMGTAVANNQPPSPPEPLLSAPEPMLPSVDSSFNFANPGFEWEPVQGAASYTLEMCRDDLCGSLLLRQTGITDQRWRAAGALPVTAMFWRVTAIGESGLDGYPSAVTPFTITSGRLDTTPPAGELQAVGQRIWVEGKLVVDETVKFEATLADSESGLATMTPWVNDRPAAESFWDGPWIGGDFEARVVAVDRSGNVGETPPLLFTVDADPPKIEWQITRDADFHGVSGRHGKWITQGIRWLEWSVDGEKWRPLVWGDQDSSLRRYLKGLKRRDLRPGALVGFEVKSTRPQVMFRAPGGEVFLESESLKLDSRQVLRVFADDLPAGVSRMRVRVKDAASEQPALVVEAIDFFGHKESVTWNLVPQNRGARASS